MSLKEVTGLDGVQTTAGIPISLSTTDRSVEFYIVIFCLCVTNPAVIILKGNKKEKEKLDRIQLE